MEIKEPTSTISTFLEDTLIGKAADEASVIYEFPRETANLIALGLVSHVVQLGYSTVFGMHRPLPCGLYVASEQGKAASKSALFDAIKGGADDTIESWNKDIIKNKKKALKEFDPDKEEIPEEAMKDIMSNALQVFITNPTPEALEHQAGLQHGVFSVASTEKTALNVLFGGMYSDDRSEGKNYELSLSGFVGEKPKVLRIKREALMTRASGAITILSQPGTVQQIMAASSNTGLSERFLMLVEPRLTKADLEKIWSKEANKSKPFLRTLDAVLTKVINHVKNLQAYDIDGRTRLKFSKESEDFINDYRKKCKLRTYDTEDVFSNEMITGFLMKSDMQVMKIAAILHVTESLINGDHVPQTIDHRYVIIAHATVFSLMRGIPIICEQAGLIGNDSLIELISGYLKGKGKKTKRQIYNAVRKREKFLAINDEKRKQAFDDALNEAVMSGAIKQNGAMVIAGREHPETYQDI